MMIAQAASEVGLDRLTMKAVAAHLGVSVAGLYHHVQGREELGSWCEYPPRKCPLPMDQGQGWTAWLLEWRARRLQRLRRPARRFINGSSQVQ